VQYCLKSNRPIVSTTVTSGKKQKFQNQSEKSTGTTYGSCVFIDFLYAKRTDLHRH